MKLLSILLLIIVFFGSFLLGFQVRAKELGIKLYDIGNASALPILTGTAAFPVLSGQGVIAVDATTNVTLYEKNADMQLYPASTTKIITALVALDYYQPQQILTVMDPTVEGQKMGLVIGEQMTFLDMLNGLLIYSANDAALTLADNYAGGREAFVNAMNTKVQELHLDHSHFSNPAGLDDPTQFTTARDMVRVAEFAMRNPIFANIVGTKNKIITDTTGRFSYSLSNVNQLLGTLPGVIGVKTGYTDAARENLVTDVVRKDHNIFVTILGSEDRFGETTELVNWIYENYSWQSVTYTQKVVGMLLR